MKFPYKHLIENISSKPDIQCISEKLFESTFSKSCRFKENIGGESSRYTCMVREASGCNWGENNFNSNEKFVDSE